MDRLEVFKDKKVLITGDTGFKGSWMATWLHDLGSDVTRIGLDPHTNRDNYVICGLKSKVNHISADIRDYETIFKIIEKVKPDIVFHFAAQALVSESYSNPRETFEINTLGTVNILEVIRNTSSVQAAVMITSDKCYENIEQVHGYRETDRLGGRDPYSASKGAAEIVIASYIRSYFSNPASAVISSVRAGNVIGGGDWSKDRIVPDFIRSIEERRPLVLRNPDAVRPWQHVLEPLYGYLLLCSKMMSIGHQFSGSWNFGPKYNNVITVKNLIRKFIDQCKKGEVIITENSKKFHEAGFLNLDISKSLYLLDWHPVMDEDLMVDYTLNEYFVNGMSTSDIYDQRSRHISEYMTLQNEVHR